MALNNTYSGFEALYGLWLIGVPHWKHFTRVRATILEETAHGLIKQCFFGVVGVFPKQKVPECTSNLIAALADLNSDDFSWHCPTPVIF